MLSRLGMLVTHLGKVRCVHVRGRRLFHKLLRVGRTTKAPVGDAARRKQEVGWRAGAVINHKGTSMKRARSNALQQAYQRPHLNLCKWKAYLQARVYHFVFAQTSPRSEAGESPGEDGRVQESSRERPYEMRREAKKN